MSVSYDKSRDKFVARVTINGKRIYLGRFYTRSEADFAVERSKIPALHDCYEVEEPEQSIGLLDKIKNIFNGSRK